MLQYFLGKNDAHCNGESWCDLSKGKCAGNFRENLFCMCIHRSELNVEF